jgi:glycosyltransferase involved in cell wall biosynthesis
LFINTHFYMPQSKGGLANTLHELCIGLQARGHNVSVLAALRQGGFFSSKMKLQMKVNVIRDNQKISRDVTLGYPVWRSWDMESCLDYVCNKDDPDVVVIAGGRFASIARKIRHINMPIVVQVHDVEEEWIDGRYSDISGYHIISNSHFTANFLSDNHGISSDVIYPVIDYNRYKVASSLETVAFINPYLRKGVDIAIKIAQLCPDIRFTFAGRLPEFEEGYEARKHDLLALENVDMLGVQEDMRNVYGRAKFILAPSRWDEAFGRVACEAAVNGLPTVGSNVGGLPEAIGGGGMLVDPSAGISDWVHAVRTLWDDDTAYAVFRKAAFESARRPSLDNLQQVAAHEAVLAKAAAASAH